MFEMKVINIHSSEFRLAFRNKYGVSAAVSKEQSFSSKEQELSKITSGDSVGEQNNFLIMGGVLSIIAALLHIGIIIGGASWYRFFGAGETMALMAEQRSWIPVVITFGIAVVLFIWGLYAFSGAGILRTLPFLKYALVIISVIYLIRGLALIPALIIMPDKVNNFVVWSSLLSLFFGLCYAIGTYQEWLGISNK